MPASGRIALVFDCDGTIAEDTTTRLLKLLGRDPDSFWNRARRMEKRGWDPTLWFMEALVDIARDVKRGQPITGQTFNDVGKKIELSDGIPAFFKEIKSFIKDKYHKHGVSLHIYVVSGGIEEIIRASRINGSDVNGPFVDEIFGCRFAYDSKGIISHPCCAVTFTEKTKYLFAINKGCNSKDLLTNPYSVNDQIADHDRPLPFQNMIYIGDGPTDVPCMSLMKRLNAEVFAVYTESRKGIPKSTHELAKQGRFTRGPFTRDYTRKSDLRRALEDALDAYAERIIGEMAARRRSAVRHS